MAAGLTTKTTGDGNSGTITSKFLSGDGTNTGPLRPAVTVYKSDDTEIDWSALATAAAQTSAQTSLTGMLTALGAIGDAAWASGNGSHTAILKTIANGILSTAAQPTYPLPATPVSGLTAAMTGTASTAVTGMGAGGSGKFNYITAITIGNSHATVGTFVELQDGNGGPTFFTLPAAALYGGATLALPTPLKQPTANTALYAKNTTTGANVIVSVSGFQA